MALDVLTMRDGLEKRVRVTPEKSVAQRTDELADAALSACTYAMQAVQRMDVLALYTPDVQGEIRTIKQALADMIGRVTDKQKALHKSVSGLPIPDDDVLPGHAAGHPRARLKHRMQAQ